MTHITSAFDPGKDPVEQFLQLVFKGSWQRAHVAGVQNGSGWGGGPWATENARITAGHGCYFSQSLFHDGQRTWTSWEALWCVVLDDIGTKVPAGTAMSALGMPAWRIESSPGNWQWGYLLSVPETDRGLCDLLFAELLRQGLCDPGAAKTGAIGYRRLPVGRNIKHPGHVITCATDPDPSASIQTWTVPEMLKAIGMDDTAIANRRTLHAQTVTPNSASAHVPVSPDTDALWRLLSELGALSGAMSGDNEGYELVSCPWVAEHTGGIDTGHATYWPPGTAKGGRGFGAFHCFHGHCAHRTVHDLRAWAEAQAGKTVAAEAFDDVTPDEADALDTIQKDEKARATAKRKAAWAYGHELAGAYAWEIERGGFVRRDDPEGKLISRGAMHETYRGRLKPALRQIGPKARTEELLNDYTNILKVDQARNWPGFPEVFDNPLSGKLTLNAWRAPTAGLKIVNEYRDMGTGLGVNIRLPDSEVEPYLTLVDHVFTGQPDLRRRVLNWLAGCLWDPTWRKPGWGVLLWSTEQGQGKDMLVEPVKRALTGHVGRVTVQTVVKSEFNDFAAKRLVHGPEFNNLGARGSINPNDLGNAIKVRLDNTDPYVRINPKGMAAHDVPNVACYWLTSNRSDALVLELGDRRVLVIEITCVPLGQPFFQALDRWLDQQDGVNKVAAWLWQRWQDMGSTERAELYGRAPWTPDKDAMIESADEVLVAVRDAFDEFPDLVAVKDAPLAGLISHLEHGTKWGREVVVKRVLSSMRALGARPYPHNPVRLPNRELRRLWVCRNREMWATLPGTVAGDKYADMLVQANVGDNVHGFATVNRARAEGTVAD